MPSDVAIRVATLADVSAIRAFGERCVVEHYRPLIGADAAQGQIDDWWQHDQLITAAGAQLIMVAEVDAAIVGVVEYGSMDGGFIIWKLYVDPGVRGGGIGLKLMDAVIAALPPGTTQLGVEHFAGNPRAAQFYQREGFAVVRVDPHSSGRSELDTVWRVRQL